MYQKPKTAKRMYFDVIPRAVDEYHQQLRAYPDQDAEGQVNNPVWHIHGGNPPPSHMVVSFAMLLNLASVAGAVDKSGLWGFIRRYAPDASPETHPDLDAAAGFALRYYRDFVAPTRQFRAPTQKERAALLDLKKYLESIAAVRAQPPVTLPVTEEIIQTKIYEIGVNHGFAPLRDWFTALYEVLLGASQGPRFGGFVALYGVEETVALIDRGLSGALAA
jgi:lysyl-tRNA synthetase class 1